MGAMRHSLLLLALGVAPVAANAQTPYPVGLHDAAIANVTSSGSRTLQSRIHYPATRAGRDAPIVAKACFGVAMDDPIDRLVEEFEVTHEEAAHAVGRSRAAVSNLLRLLDLEEDVKDMVEHGQLEMGHARALLALSGKKQVDAARRVVAGGLSVRAT